MNSCQCWNWNISIDFTSVALKQTNLYKYEKDDVKNVNRMHSLFRSLKHYYQALTHKHARTLKHTHTLFVWQQASEHELRREEKIRSVFFSGSVATLFLSISFLFLRLFFRSQFQRTHDINLLLFILFHWQIFFEIQIQLVVLLMAKQIFLLYTHTHSLKRLNQPVSYRTN